MFIVLGVIIIMLYLLNETLGFFATSIIMLSLLMNKKENIIIKLFKVLLLSLPMSYIGIFGISMNHIFSWYNIFLVIYMIVLMKYYKKITKTSMLVFIIVFLILVLELLWATDISKSIIETIQILLMLIPIMITFNVKSELPLKNIDCKKLMFLFSDICIATAICMLIQWWLHYYLNLDIGIIEYYGFNRVSFFCLFRGASVLPVFMGIGFLILFIELIDNRLKLSNIIKMLIILIAMILNTSRTGIVSLFLVLFFIIGIKFLKRPNLKIILLTVSSMLLAFVSINYLISIRAGINGILDDNGRFSLIYKGLEVFSSNIKTILFGAGFTGEEIRTLITIPHNFLIQTLAQNGLIITIIIFLLIFTYFKKNKNNKYKYIILFILLSGMFITDFYANAFITFLFIVVDICGVDYDNKLIKNL